jgi:alpha-tubulin suppressor-like RCC1 family protein
MRPRGACQQGLRQLGDHLRHRWDGGAVVLGRGRLGQLGLGSGVVAPKADCSAIRGTVTDVDCFPEPVRVGLSPGASSWVQLDLGTAHACGVDAANGLYCWGDDAFEQLGNGSGGSKATPFAVVGSWRAVAAYDDHTCGVKSDSTFACWGANGSHEFSSGIPTKFDAPLALTGFDMVDGWSEVAAGNQHVCGIQGGLPWCWGGNVAGQTGVPNATNPVSDIMPVVGPPDTGFYTQLFAGSSFTCAMRSMGAAPVEGWCWGSNLYGQFGTGVMGAAAGEAATQVPWGDYNERLAVGAFHACGIDAGGRLDCWGRSNYGQLGTGRLGADLGNGNRGEDSGLTAARVGDAADWTGVGLGRFHSCGIREGGRLYCWGRNSAGQLGVGMTGVSIGAQASAIAEPTRVCFTP